MCAVGCLIDRKHYSKSLEGTSIHTNEVLQAVSSSIGRLSSKQLYLLSELQVVTMMLGINIVILSLT